MYYEALARYESGPERLRRHWESLIQGFPPAQQPVPSSDVDRQRRPGSACIS
jgi:hypothetical protein